MVEETAGKIQVEGKGFALEFDKQAGGFGIVAKRLGQRRLQLVLGFTAGVLVGLLMRAVGIGRPPRRWAY